ncbi:hypothetical protein AX14_002761 [Amanita brunnescens Koide BX004]|nr:hypothetical protein AX14_002761 [Amanita brunnescens Koide BX004]
MLFNANFVVLAALFAVGVHAQGSSTTGSVAAAPTSTSQIPPCVLSCAEGALKATNGTCESIVDPCICTNTAFQDAAEKCLQAKCSAADQQAALALDSAQCGSFSSSSSGSATATSGSASSSGSATPGPAPAASSGSSSKSGSSSGSSTGSGSSSSASAKASAGDKISLGQTGLFAVGISVIGAVIGGLMV